MIDISCVFLMLVIWLNTEPSLGFFSVKVRSMSKSRAPRQIRALVPAHLGSTLSMNSGKDDEEESNDNKAVIEVDEEGVVYRKGKKASGIPIEKRDNRDNMPYKTFIMMDDKARSAKLIATLQLDALTACQT